MIVTLKQLATARRNLAWRIDKLIKKLEIEKKEPTAWEQHYVTPALHDLKRERYRIGEDTIHWAAAPHIFDDPRNQHPLPDDAHKATTAALRAELQRLFSNK